MNLATLMSGDVHSGLGAFVSLLNRDAQSGVHE
jgi:hypothetical protein